MNTTYAQTEEKEVRFYLRSSYKNIKPLYFFFFFILVSGILLLSDFGNYHKAIGVVVTIFSLMIGTFIISQNITYRSFYAVYPDHIVLRRGLSRRILLKEDIEEVKIMDENQVRELLLNYKQEEIKSRNNMNELESFTAMRRLGKVLAYCTVPIEFIPTESSDYELIIDNNSRAEFSFVFLKSKTGTKVLLSPKDCLAFVSTIQSNLN